MDKIFKIDFKKLAQWLLPFKLRKKAVLAFLYAMFAPLETLYKLFTRNRDNNLYRLLITPQICYLEKFLNDRYDFAARRIYIGEGIYNSVVYFYMLLEDKKVWMCTRLEGNPLFLYMLGETTSTDTDFIVHLPDGLVYDENQMRGEIDSYKLAGKKYQIATP